MRVLNQGRIFHVDNTPIDLYRGPHEIRTLGGYRELTDPCDYHYDPPRDTIHDVLDRIGPAWRPEMLLCWFTEEVPPPMGIEDCPIPTVAIVSDWNLYYSKIALNLARYDVVVCDRPGVAVLENRWIAPKYLCPVYSQVTPVHKPYPVEKDLDVVYVGGMNTAVRPVRARFLERLAKLSDRYRVLLATNFEGDEYSRLLSRARMVFNHSVRGELNLRVFETFACGALAMLEEGNPGAEGWFEDGREVVFYNDRNFEDRIRYYLEHPGEAAAVAARGHARAAEFAGENRLTALIDQIGNCALSGCRKYRDSPVSLGDSLAGDSPCVSGDSLAGDSPCVSGDSLSGGSPGSSETPRKSRRFHELPGDVQEFQTIMMHSYSRFAACRELEKELVGRFAAAHPDDARAWTAIGRCLFNPFHGAKERGDLVEPCCRAFGKAHELEPTSAPYAYNAAEACRRFGRAEAEETRLRQTLDADGLSGEDLVVGQFDSPFWMRWLCALAYKRAAVAMLHAEAHIRLAGIEAGRGNLAQAEAHLSRAGALDPENHGGVRLLAKTLWAAGRREEAAELLLLRLPDLPFDIEGRQVLAHMLRELGRAEEAVELDTGSERLCDASVVKPFARGRKSVSLEE